MSRATLVALRHNSFFWKVVLEFVDEPFGKGGSCGIGKKCNTIMNII